MAQSGSMGFHDLPGWLPEFCREQLGSEPAELLFEARSISVVFGLRLTGGAEVVVKVRTADPRIAACVAAQTALAEAGFPCPRPLTEAIEVGWLMVHAEAHWPGGELLRGDAPAVAVRYAEVFAALMDGLRDVDVAPPLPNPRWSRWDHTDSGVWPAIGFLDKRDQRVVTEHVLDIAVRVRRRLLASTLPPVLGHADFEAQNLRWRDGELWVVHDWDSLAWQPEAALAGAASAAFANAGPPSLAPIDSSAAFLETYQRRRGRAFTAEELEVAWAASLWTAAHNARWELLHGSVPLSGIALLDQAAERLRRANA
ncbi:Phosphotransferase enzyme family protein [Jiangella sp. DSM 45060]|nr:phosphotransferase [Jiangella sp. DSM 45060]SDS58170.1 Phosphotransferase enzyme family protein [Jiangella sp. DSM 45060]